MATCKMTWSGANIRWLLHVKQPQFSTRPLPRSPLKKDLGTSLVNFDASVFLACVAVVSFPRAREARESEKSGKKPGRGRRAKAKRAGKKRSSPFGAGV